MPMSYQPKFPQLRESICVYGPNGVGKTNVTITMMRRMTDRHFHIFDNNNAYDFAIFEDDERNAKIIAAENFTIHPADFTDYVDQKRVIEEIVEAVQPGDWAVFDYLDPIWESLPGWYTEVFLGLDETEYKASVRRALEEQRQNALGKNERQQGNTPLFDRLRDYTYLNPEYKKAVYGAFSKINAKGAHVLCMASSKPVKDNDDKDIRKRYSSVGARPASQKGLTGEVNTVLYLQWDGEDEWTMTTAKDRASRTADDKLLTDVEWKDFCSVYLSPVARWSMVKVD